MTRTPLTTPHRGRSAPVTPRDLWAVAGYAAFAGVLLSPLRHYVGTPKDVKRNKFARDSFPLSTYPMFSTDRKGRVTVPHVIGITDDGDRKSVVEGKSGWGVGRRD